MKEYTLVFKNPFTKGFKLTKLEFLAFDEMLDATGPADKKTQEGGHILMLSEEFDNRLIKNRNVKPGVSRSCMVKLVNRGIYNKVKGTSSVYQLNPYFYGKVLDDNDLSDIEYLRNTNKFTKE